MDKSDFPIGRYRATLIEAHDGDTVKLNVNLSKRLAESWIIRIKGIDAPEITSNVHGKADPAGPASRDFLLSLLKDSTIYVDLGHTEVYTFGRLVADLYIEPPDGDQLVKVADLMINSGHAKFYEVHHAKES